MQLTELKVSRLLPQIRLQQSKLVWLQANWQQGIAHVTIRKQLAGGSKNQC